MSAQCPKHNRHCSYAYSTVVCVCVCNFELACQYGNETLEQLCALKAWADVRRQLMMFTASGSLYVDVISHDHHSFVQSLIAVGMADVT